MKRVARKQPATTRKNAGAVAARRATVAAHREELAASIRADILEAALRAFTQHGHAAVTMRDIANEAGYTAGALYSYFKNKEAIMAGILEMMLVGTLTVFDAPVDGKLAFPVRVEQLVHALLSQVDRRRDVFQLLMALQMDPHAMPPQMREAARQGIVEERMATWIRSHGSRKDLGGVDVEDVAHLLVGMISGMAMGWMKAGNKRALLADRAPLITGVLFHGILGR